LLRLDLLRGAFQNLDAYSFTRVAQTEQLSKDGVVMARKSKAVHYQFRDGARAVVAEPLASDSAFQFGFFGRFAPREDADSDLSSVADALIPEDPAYLSPRTRDDFTYIAGPDTMLNGMHVKILKVEAVPDAAEQSARRARLYYDPQSYAVVALFHEHASPALVFRESTSLYVQIRPGADGQWVPDTTSVSTRIHLPLTEARHFRAVSAFTNFSRARH
jgi:hypothetical protein